MRGQATLASTAAGEAVNYLQANNNSQSIFNPCVLDWLGLLVSSFTLNLNPSIIWQISKSFTASSRLQYPNSVYYPNINVGILLRTCFYISDSWIRRPTSFQWKAIVYQRVRRTLKDFATSFEARFLYWRYSNWYFKIRKPRTSLDEIQKSFERFEDNFERAEPLPTITCQLEKNEINPLIWSTESSSCFCSALWACVSIKIPENITTLQRANLSDISAKVQPSDSRTSECFHLWGMRLPTSWPKYEYLDDDCYIDVELATYKLVWLRSISLSPKHLSSTT